MSVTLDAHISNYEFPNYYAHFIVIFKNKNIKMKEYKSSKPIEVEAFIRSIILIE